MDKRLGTIPLTGAISFNVAACVETSYKNSYNSIVFGISYN